MTIEDSQFFDESREIALSCLSRASSAAPVEHKYLESAGAYRFFQSVRGGAAVIVGRDGSFLFANSSVPPVKHEEAFVAGRRTDPDVFEKEPGS